MKLKDYHNHYDLKTLRTKELSELAEDLRTTIITTVKKNGGHLASNLGTVELTISLLKSFDIDNNDLILFDTGHQTYPYKILTDRKEQFSTIRLPHGLSAFQSPQESKYDYLANGHAGTALSTAIAYSYNPQYQNVVCIIGDAAFTNGLTFEALNHLGTIANKVIIILNDNEMSISKNISILHTTISKFRASWFYKMMAKISKVTRYIPPFTLLYLCHLLVEKLIHRFAIPGLFAGFNLDYIGKIDGHNFRKLTRALKNAKKTKGSVLVHVNTKKGKGYPEENPTSSESCHSYSLVTKPESEWSYYVAHHLQKVFRNQKFYLISAAMQSSLYLEEFMNENKDYCIDVGIAEEHGVTLASGFALDHHKVIVSMYSTFLQRAYDEILHDVVRNHLPVIFLIDRASLSLADGVSHHGVYDISFLNSMGGFAIIAQPANDTDFNQMLQLALANDRDPFFIRYPKMGITYNDNPAPFTIGEWEYYLSSPTAQYLIITYGNNVEHFKKLIINHQLTAKVNLVNARFINPIDEKMMQEIIAHQYQQIIIYEEVVKQGGLFSNIINAFPNLDLRNIKHYAYEHGLLTKNPLHPGDVIKENFGNL
ncbi:1-deoxy-D-xylulose-5-phosphate synthase [Spiroplasma sp. DGKH1]|uniref:1-deoxy-D-xylulose-5-phosphate synthase n=1 Tax=Spiroplasma sp. DGKH1 TaxID=3050074 RepID=UPI0034C625E6